MLHQCSRILKGEEMQNPLKAFPTQTPSQDFSYIPHSGIIFQSGYTSDHIGNPFSPPLFYPHRSKYPAPFNLMWPRINIQKILDPLCSKSCLLTFRQNIHFISSPSLDILEPTIDHRQGWIQNFVEGLKKNFQRWGDCILDAVLVNIVVCSTIEVQSQIKEQISLITQRMVG